MASIYRHSSKLLGHLRHPNIGTSISSCHKPNIKAPSPPSSHFTTSTLQNYPRKPPAWAPPAYKPATPSQLASPPVPKRVKSKPIPRVPNLPIWIRLARPKPQKRHLDDTQTAVPLPTTYPAAPKPDVSASSGRFAATYYEITLLRGFKGVSKQKRIVASALGLHGRHEVVYRRCGPRCAGQILAIRELVKVRLVNEIPRQLNMPKGFVKVGSNLARNVLPM
ncbi:hypothetical protein SmJEL517_g00893 [Synchytrium microbalum]|uniref:Large ribosomal subunit protein uL30-like ferredoxin-like fold domain-containing protein n=1 Tax=Synchytrium microbalum TaxID=1806994 RepID=A0A507CDC0_9FUNG|nr:uncharacterized protein SmJEL517_g00893 [Synchytrium microbalum]TPX37169.1 hypothetical protein SmJEL517_g00893 [Synchytrium microbalum]